MFNEEFKRKRTIGFDEFYKFIQKTQKNSEELNKHYYQIYKEQYGSKCKQIMLWPIIQILYRLRKASDAAAFSKFTSGKDDPPGLFSIIMVAIEKRTFQANQISNIMILYQIWVKGYGMILEATKIKANTPAELAILE